MTNPRKKSVTSKLLSWGVAVATAAIMAVTGSGMAKAEVKTIEAGKLTIGMNGDMPMTQLKDGVLSGTDGEIMTWIAGQIGLKPNVAQMDWAALIEATKQGKLDVMHGAMGWIEPRT
jgi:polar amino acid transport system substrate-binding protein